MFYSVRPRKCYSASLVTKIWGHYEVLSIRRHEGAECYVDSAGGTCQLCRLSLSHFYTRLVTKIWGHYEVLSIRRHEGAECYVDSAGGTCQLCRLSLSHFYTR